MSFAVFSRTLSFFMFMYIRKHVVVMWYRGEAEVSHFRLCDLNEVVDSVIVQLQLTVLFPFGQCFCCRPDLGMRIVCEQVSHHPPVSAFHVESPLYVFHGSVHPKIKFWGKSVDVTPKGLVTLVLKRYIFMSIFPFLCNFETRIGQLSMSRKQLMMCL